MFRGQTLSIVLTPQPDPGPVLDEFRASPLVDEVLLVAGPTGDSAAVLGEAAGVRVIREASPYFGNALVTGMGRAKGEILVSVSGPECRARDLEKLLVLLEDGELAIGTRTRKGVTSFVRRWTNLAIAKLLQTLWLVPHEPRLTDVTCGFRAIRRENWQRIRHGVGASPAACWTGMVCTALTSGCRVVEAPVSSQRSHGESRREVFGRDPATLPTVLAILRRRLWPAQKPT